jgi:hypothetical protein
MRIVVGLMLLVLGGCANWGKQLYIAHDTKLGVDASINTATSSGSIDLGYDRRFLTWVPRSVDVEEGASKEEGDGKTKAKEVMSVMACSNLRVGIVQVDYYDESLATGRAAVKFAEALADPEKPHNKKVAHDYFECFTKKEENSDKGDSR